MILFSFLLEFVSWFHRGGMGLGFLKCTVLSVLSIHIIVNIYNQEQDTIMKIASPAIALLQFVKT
jgi:hypothetical protein